MPVNGDDEVRIEPSQESADCLARVPGIHRWRVEPTMTRGSKAAGLSKKSLSKAKPGKKQTTKRKAKGNRKSTKKTTKKSKKSKAKKDTLIVEYEMCEADFRRTPYGRSRIESVFEDLQKLDEKAFRDSPTFTSEGVLRMKFENANSFTWKDILEDSAKAIENMQLDKHSFL